MRLDGRNNVPKKAYRPYTCIRMIDSKEINGRYLVFIRSAGLVYIHVCSNEKRRLGYRFLLYGLCSRGTNASAIRRVVSPLRYTPDFNTSAPLASGYKENKDRTFFVQQNF